MRKNRLLHCFAVFGIAWISIFFSYCGWALADEISCANPTPTEQWVANQLAEGKAADLTKYQGSRNIRSQCLETMLTGDGQFRIHHHGIQIDKAVFTGRLTLERAEIPYFVKITNSIFRGDVRFDYTFFKQDLILDGSVFEKDVSFFSVSVGRDFTSNNAEFNGQTSFAAAHIGRLFLMNDASFTNSSNVSTDFSQNEFDVERKDSLILCEALKRDGFEPYTPKACGDTVKENIDWLNALIARTDLNGKMTAVKRLIPPEQACGPAQIVGKHQRQPIPMPSIDKQASIKLMNRLKIELAYPDEAPRRIAVFFTALETGHNVHLDGASFNGPVDFRSAIIGRSFYANYGTFKDISVFTGIKVLGNKTAFTSACFKRPFFFDKAKIAGDLIISDNANFSESASFYGSTIGTDLLIDRASFSRLNASNIRVEGPATFSDVKIKDSVTFQDSKFRTLVFDKVSWPDNEAEKVSADYTSNEFESPRDIKILCEVLTADIKPETKEKIKASANTIAWLNELLGDLNMYNDIVNKKPHLVLTDQIMKLRKQARQFDARPDNKSKAIKQLNRLMIELAYPLQAPKRGLLTDGLSYGELGAFAESRNKLGRLRETLCGMHIPVCRERPEVELLEKGRFNIQNYVELESFFKRLGHDDWADDVYIKGRQLELQNRKPWGPGDYLTIVFWDKLAGFGRRPFRIIYVSFFILLLGAKVFSPQYFDKEFRNKWGLADHDDNPSRSKTLSLLRRSLLSFSVRMGLSLDIFIPTHHPGLLDHWRRSAIPTGVLVYYYLHKLCGMILVPIAAAAFFTHLRISG